MFKSISIYVVVMLLSGCAAVSELQQQHHKISTELAATEHRLTTKLDQSCQFDHQQLASEISSLIKIKRPPVPVKKVKPKIVYIERCSEVKVKGRVMTSDKLMLGQVEQVTLTKEQRSFDARIDTGAVTSSLGVYNLSRFERDGKKWVQFSLDQDSDAATYQYPIIRIIRIALSSINKVSRREVIELNFKLGAQSYNAEFSLANRKHLEYQVLIGREFLLDRAIVDVSSHHLIEQE